MSAVSWSAQRPMADLEWVARTTGGRLVGSNATFESVGTDSRHLWAGQLFVALRGPSHDGAAFVAAARAVGAAGAVVERAQPSDLPQVVVADTRRALGAIARAWRSGFDIPVVAITGSNGKTTTKEMTGAILRELHGGPAGDESPVLVTRGNLNNEIGVPVTLLWLRDRHRAAVIEMGASEKGSIGYLAGIAQPTVGFVNNAAPAHLAGFGAGVADVAAAKGELYTGMPADAVAIINRDDEFHDYWRRLAGSRPVRTFGLHPAADFRATDIRNGSTLAFTMHTPSGAVDVKLPMAGGHNVRNALGATAVAMAAGAGLAHVVAGLAGMRNVRGRLYAVTGPAGSTIYDDSYNANPGSVRAAIEFLSGLPGQRWLVLGDMRELGGDEVAFHRETGEAARRAGIDRLYCVGELCRATAEGFGEGAHWASEPESLAAGIGEELAPGVSVLVKGSRSMGMERLVRLLAPDAAQEGAH